MGTVKTALAVAAVSEIATGVALILAPSVIGQLLFGMELTGIAITIASLTGIALIGLGVACLPATPLLGMLTYSVGAALYLAYLGFAGRPSGILLWPAVVAHVIFATLLMRASTHGKST